MDYLKHLEKAIIFIENNLLESIKVEEVAGIAGYSYYHFHRIFEAVVGETVGNYLRLRRLTKAAHDLLYTEQRILDIALCYQFESQEAFNRAFKKVFKVTPGIYRKNRIEVIFGEKKPLSFAKLQHLKQKVTLQPQIKEIGELLIVGIRSTTTLRKNRIPEMWAQFKHRIEEIPHRVLPLKAYGICEVDPEYYMSKFNEDTEFSEFVGVEVREVDSLPPEMTVKSLTGGRYAVFTHRGKLDTLAITYHYIFGTWLPCSKYQLDLRDDFEFYDERFLGLDNEQSEMDIYIPIK